MDTTSLSAQDEFEDYRYTQRIAVVVRWFVLATWLSVLNYRISVDDTTLYILNAMGIGLAAVNAYVQWRILKGRPVSWSYTLALSLMDLAVITTGIGITTRFANAFFVFYYPALLGLSLVFSSARLAFTTVFLVAVAYSGISLTLEPKLSFDAGHEKALLVRIVTMFAVVAAGTLTVRIERARRREAVEAERVQWERNLELQARAQEAELAAQRDRERIARDIHDGIAQSIYALSINIETFADMAEREGMPLEEDLRKLVPIARRTHTEARNLIPFMTGERDLAALARTEVEQFRTVARTPATLSAHGALDEVSVFVAVNLLRVLQEALANILKHANASRVDVRLHEADGSLTLTIEDDGVGFDQEHRAPGYGLENMRKRAEELDGTFAVTSSSQTGTRIDVTVPREESENGPD